MGAIATVLPFQSESHFDLSCLEPISVLKTVLFAEMLERVLSPSSKEDFADLLSKTVIHPLMESATLYCAEDHLFQSAKRLGDSSFESCYAESISSIQGVVTIILEGDDIIVTARPLITDFGVRTCVRWFSSSEDGLVQFMKQEIGDEEIFVARIPSARAQSMLVVIEELDFIDEDDFV